MSDDVIFEDGDAVLEDGDVQFQGTANSGVVTVAFSLRRPAVSFSVRRALKSHSPRGSHV